MARALSGAESMFCHCTCVRIVFNSTFNGEFLLEYRRDGHIDPGRKVRRCLNDAGGLVQWAAATDADPP